jgi:hypothetical protein
MTNEFCPLSELWASEKVVNPIMLYITLALDTAIDKLHLIMY